MTLTVMTAVSLRTSRCKGLRGGAYTLEFYFSSNDFVLKNAQKRNCPRVPLIESGEGFIDEKT